MERHLPDSCLQTVMEHTDSRETREGKKDRESFQPALWLSSVVEKY